MLPQTSAPVVQPARSESSTPVRSASARAAW